MAVTIPNIFSKRQTITHTQLNANFAAVSSKFNTDGITDADISANADIAGSKLDLTASTGRIAQITTLSDDSNPAASFTNTGNGGIIKLTNSGTGSDIFIDDNDFIVNVDADADGSSNRGFTVKVAGSSIFSATEGGIAYSLNGLIHNVHPFEFTGELNAQVGNSIAKYDALGRYLIASTANAVVFSAPIQLPNNAKITELKAFYNKATSTSAGNVSLISITASGGTRVTMGMASFTGSAGTIVSAADSSILNATVNNASLFYQVMASIDNGVTATEISLYGVRLTYNLTVN